MVKFITVIHKKRFNVASPATGMITVWDVEKRGVRRLNLDTLVGRIIPLTA